MKRNSAWSLSAVAAASLLMLVDSAASADRTLKEQIVGVWRGVNNVTTRQDGSKFDTFGPNPTSIAIFEGNGHYAIISIRAGIPSFISKSRVSGTNEENKSVVDGSIAHFGTYTVDEDEKSLTAHIEGSTFPNWTGIMQKRMIKVSGDNLTLSNEGASAGGNASNEWKRVK